MITISNYISEKLHIKKGFKGDSHKPISEIEFINYLSKEGSINVFSDVNNTGTIKKNNNGRSVKYPFINCVFKDKYFTQTHLDSNTGSMIIIRTNSDGSIAVPVENADYYDGLECYYTYTENNANIIINLLNEKY